MNCEQYRDALLQQFDGSSGTDETFADHARTCPRCAALHDAGLRLSAGLAHWPRSTVPADLTQSMLAGVQMDQRRLRRLRRAGAFACAVAASLLVAAGLTYFWPRPQPFESPVVKNTEPAPPETTVTLRDTVNQAGQAVSQLTARTADTTVEQTRSFWPMVTPPGLDEWDKQPPLLDPPGRPLQETGQSAVAAMEPVTNSARRAFGMLLHDMQPMDKQTKPDS